MTSHGTVLPLTKNVVVYKNGDPFFNGRKFVVSQKQFATYESFLNEVTSNIQAPAAVRNLYTPREGHRVHDLSELQSGSQYVAAGFERFKKLDYLNPGSKKPAGSKKRDGLQIRPVYRVNVSAKWRKHIHMPSVIHVFRNGDLLCPPFRIIIPKNMRQDWENILIEVTEKANLRTGAVRRNHPGNRRITKGNEYRKATSVPQDGVSDSALLHSPEESDSRRVKSTGAAGEDISPVSPQARRRKPQKNTGKEEQSLFYAKPVRVRHSTKNSKTTPQETQEEDSGVFKVNRERQEVQRAPEVPEDENIRVELPVDQRVAETVEDETIAAYDHGEDESEAKIHGDEAVPLNHTDRVENGELSYRETKRSPRPENRSSHDYHSVKRNGRTSHASSHRLQE
ncbi:doublecortin domain-containing protein 2B isoform X2 [Polyodon spathula]|uniref:doublecortin domain-containing protein 2B isoform X2 n=1 Tax=Polyodon spathula TaxID=7913 RepID=UPI001B7E7C65|nr:doublecortin domain-containing protein 2B isoform X2 [Polyodon spathula]